MPLQLNDLRYEQPTVTGAAKKLTDVVTVHACCVPTDGRLHAGTARTFITADLAVRQLSYDNRLVAYIASCDDAANNQPLFRVTKNLAVFEQSIKEIGVGFRAGIERTSDHVPGLVTLVQRLIETGRAYHSKGSVFARTTRSKSYGSLSKLLPEDRGRHLPPLRAGQEGWADFLLWQPSKNDEPIWDSPWGPGRPGPHATCWVLGRSRLGRIIDVRFGAKDLAFPHHENELALGRLISGNEGESARVWVLAGTQQLPKFQHISNDGEIMKDDDVVSMIEKYGSQAVRMAFLEHESGPRTTIFSKQKVQKSVEKLQELQDLYDRLRVRGYSGDASPTDVAAQHREKIKVCLGNDLDTDGALKLIADIGDLSKEAYLNGGNIAEWIEILVEMTGRLGITLKSKDVFASVREFEGHDAYEVRIIGEDQELAKTIAEDIFAATKARYLNDRESFRKLRQTAWGQAKSIQTVANSAYVIAK